MSLQNPTEGGKGPEGEAREGKGVKGRREILVIVKSKEKSINRIKNFRFNLLEISLKWKPGLRRTTRDFPFEKQQLYHFRVDLRMSETENNFVAEKWKHQSLRKHR